MQNPEWVNRWRFKLFRIHRSKYQLIKNQIRVPSGPQKPLITKGFFCIQQFRFVLDLYRVEINRKELEKELLFRTSRSSGSGGQHVNKVESRVEVVLNIPNSIVLSDIQKQIITARLKTRIDSSGNIAVSSSSSRSQNQNKKIAIKRLFDLLELALRKKKIRKKTGIPKSVKEARLKSKKKRSEIKANRNFKADF